MLCDTHKTSLIKILYKNAVRSIEEEFVVQTNPANPCNDCLLHDRFTRNIIRSLTASEEIIEVSEIEFMRINGEHSEGTLAIYEPGIGRIMLIEERWCLSHIFHETLHSRSSFCVGGDTPQGLLYVIEGLTELLTGKVLKSKLTKCYEEWCILGQCFCNSYIDYLKPWYFLDSKRDISPVISLFFDIGERNPFQKLDEILEELLGDSYTSIFSFSQPYEAYLANERFADTLSDIFDDFTDFYQSPLTQIML